MTGSSILSELNLIGHCKKYGFSTWQCPHFLFVVMGLLIILSSIVSYALATKTVQDPLLAALFTLGLASILLVFAFIITGSFQRLAEASQLKSEFVGIVSHQLRAPISNLQWSLEFLMAGRAGSIQQEQLPYLQILRENTQRMHDLVNDLLMVSRISQGTLPLTKKEFSFKELLNDIVAEFDAWSRASNMSVKLQPDDRVGKIKSDASLIRQVIQNFLDNAIRYGKSEIDIRYSLKGGKLHFEVNDNGLGIPKPEQKNVFQKFFRSHNAARHQTDGSGLGLYIAKSMVEKLGGSIGFSSEEHKGSIFWFTIPIT